jgi:hypothetical protein
MPRLRLIGDCLPRAMVLTVQVSVEQVAYHIIELLPEDGSPVVNRVMRTMVARDLEVAVSPELYFAALDYLASKKRIGRSRGQGGGVFLAQPAAGKPDELKIKDSWSEAKLMGPLECYLREHFVKTLDLPSGSTWITANASSAGPKTGQWSRPDFISVSVMRFQLLPGRDVQVHSFELKTETAGTVQAVHEALAQTRFTHFGHLVWHLPFGSKDEVRLADVTAQCETHGIGLILIRHPDELQTWEIKLDPTYKKTSAATVDAFLLSRLSAQQTEQLKNAVFGG